MHLRQLHAKGNVSVPLIVTLAILAVLGLFLIGSYNGLVTLDATVSQKAADIDSQLKRRADLVPNLVATVKGYAKHEQEIFTAVSTARSRLLNSNVAANSAEAASANQVFNSAMGRLLAIAENYPQLKADQNFIRLQDELAGTENRINYARLEYNDTVRQFNVNVRSFPTNLLAGLFGFEAKKPFQASEADKALPQVSF